MPVQIRPAGPQDAHELHQMIIELACYENAEECVKVTAYDLEKQLRDEKPPFECAIAEIDGRIAGFALWFYAYSTWEGAQTLHLEDLFVRPEFRGARLGEALMHHLARTAQEKRCRRFEWSVLDWNEPAIGFYEKLGAQPLNGWTRYRLEDRSINELVNGSSCSSKEFAR